VKTELPQYVDTSGSVAQRLNQVLESMGTVNEGLSEAYAQEDWHALDDSLRSLWRAQPALWDALDAVFGPEWPSLIKIDLDFWSDTLAGNCVAEGIDTTLT
jgi:hypothetical protein